LINLLLSAEDELAKRLANVFQLTGREDPWRPFVDWIDAVFCC
jgi:hypothetical protein